MKNVLRSIAALLVIIGAINWGLIGLFNVNLVHQLLAAMPTLEKLVYVAVGIAGLLLAYYEIEGCKCAIVRDNRDR